MLARAGVESDLLYDGLDLLEAMPVRFKVPVQRGLQVAAARAVRDVLAMRAYRRFLSRVRHCQVIVIVAGLPHPYTRGTLKVEELRAKFPDTPIVLYDLFYLGTRGPWAKWIRDGNPEKGLPPGGYGLERFDWYLTASIESEVPLPCAPQPISIIGVDLDDGSLRLDEKGEFKALLDFEYPPRMRERAVQILACEETGTAYEILNGHYSIDDIRAVYRSTSAFFLSMRESFGLPICEVQACGAYVFTPYANWAPAHWIKPDPHARGAGKLSQNFVVYENDKETLKNELLRIKSSYDATQVVRIFGAAHRRYFHGDDDALRDFLRRVEAGEIHSRRHLEYQNLLCDLMQQDFSWWP